MNFKSLIVGLLAAAALVAASPTEASAQVPTYLSCPISEIRHMADNILPAYWNPDTADYTGMAGFFIQIDAICPTIAEALSLSMYAWLNGQPFNPADEYGYMNMLWNYVRWWFDQVGAA